MLTLNSSEPIKGAMVKPKEELIKTRAIAMSMCSWYITPTIVRIVISTMLEDKPWIALAAKIAVTNKGPSKM